MGSHRDLTQGAVWRRLLQLTLPMIFGIIAVLSISLADTYFVGQLGTNPLAALSFTFPVTMTIASLSIGLGAGAASVVSRAIGGGDRRLVKRLSTDSLLLAVSVVATVSLLGYLTIRPLFTLLGANGEVLNLIERYMRIWYISMPFLVIPMVANALIRSAGDAFWPSLIMIAAAIINIGVTPMLIFGWWIFPQLDIEGAAWGTFIARAATLIIALLIVALRERMLSWEIPSADELIHSWKRVLGIGLPAAGGNMVNPIGIAVVTAILATYGDATVAAFGVATRIESFAAIPMLALSSSIGPLAGQNWGAERTQRVIAALRLSYWSCAVWALLMALALWLMAEPIVQLFSNDPDVIAQARHYLLIVPVSLWGYGVVIVGAAAFNSLGKPMVGLGYYLMRTALLYIPLSWLASLYAQQSAVYYAIAFSNGVAGFVVMLYSVQWLRNCLSEPDSANSGRNLST